MFTKIYSQVVVLVCSESKIAFVRVHLATDVGGDSVGVGLCLLCCFIAMFLILQAREATTQTLGRYLVRDGA